MLVQSQGSVLNFKNGIRKLTGMCNFKSFFIIIVIIIIIISLFYFYSFLITTQDSSKAKGRVLFVFHLFVLFCFSVLDWLLDAQTGSEHDFTSIFSVKLDRCISNLAPVCVLTSSAWVMKRSFQCDPTAEH